MGLWLRAIVMVSLVAVLAVGCRDSGNGDDDVRLDAVDDGGSEADAPVPDGDAGEVEDALDEVETEGSADADADADADGDADGDGDGDGDGDADADAGSTPSPPAEVLRTGTGGFVLRGVVLAPDDVLDPGEVFVGADGNIACVAADCSGTSGADTATLIDTHGIISPGLIDAHNHIAYNFLPEWVPSPPRLFENRYQWAADLQYETHIEPYAAHRSAGTHYCPAAKWGELRSLVHGTTTVQGQSFEQSCVNWGIRNADHYHGLGHDHMQTTIASVRDITDADAAGYVANFTAATDPTTRFAVHMCEGYANDDVLEEFDSFAGRDPRPNRHADMSLLVPPTSLLIHSLVLTPEQIAEARAADASVAWSPSSNMVLYGRTAPIAEILAAGIVVALGPDWTPSGEDEMLSEMRFAYGYGVRSGIGALTRERVWRMATADGARSATRLSAIGVFGRRHRGLRAHGWEPRRGARQPRRGVRLVLLGGGVSTATQGSRRRRRRTRTARLSTPAAR